MATDDALNAIFKFRFQRPSDVQTAVFCEELLQVVDQVVCGILSTRAIDKGGNEDGDAVRKDTDDDDDEGQGCNESTMHVDPLVHDRDVPLDVFSTSDRMFLERARRQYSARDANAKAMPTKGEMWTEAWFPQYGSVLQMECVSAGTVMLRLVALDGWKRVLHFLPGEVCVHSAVPEEHDQLHCGQLEWAEYVDFGPALQKELEAAKKRTGNMRHATLGQGPGHQKTPAFLCAMIRTALSAGKVVHPPTGGTTDVGMHTGGPPRDTCWPLVRSMLKQALPGSRSLFEKVQIRLQCTLLASQVGRLRSLHGVKDFWLAADVAFAMLQATVTLIAEMIDRGYASSHLEQECVRWREEIDLLVQAWSDHSPRSFVLPDPKTLKTIGTLSNYPVLSRPGREELVGSQGAFKAGREKALKENQGYEVIDGRTCSTEQILQYLRLASTSGVEDQVAVGQRVVETFMSGLANGLRARSSATACEPSALLEITNWYRNRRSKFATERKYDQVARVTTDSQLLLMSWVAFSLCHKNCCDSHPWLQKHRIALDWKRLGVAVLPEKEARTALLHVAAYIQQWNSQDGLLPPVFKFSDPKGTILFARSMGQQLSAYPAMHQRHLDEKRDQITAMWAKIERRQRRVASLRDDIAETRSRLGKAQAELREEENDIARKKSCGQYFSRYRPDELERHVRRISQKIKEMENELSGQVKLPEFYVSPLPTDKIEALAVLFLNYLPLPLDILSELCGLAQRELGSDDSSEYQVSPPCETSWANHIAAYGQRCFNETPTKYTTEYPRELKVPSDYGPMSIDDVSSRDQFARVCSWYPVGNSNHIFWQDRRKVSSLFVDPFKIPKSDSLLHFTADLSPETEMQWSVSFPGGSTRGNLTYAKSRVTTAADDDFAAFVALGSLRCYPVQQLRRLFSAVQANSLDWSVQGVATVVKQAAFQVGSLTDDGSIPQLEWHTDLDRPQSLEELCAIIEVVAKRVDSSPSAWKCVPLLGGLAGFLDQSRSGGRQAVRSLCRTARRWAQDDRQKWLSGVPTDERIDLRTRECLLYGFALVCYSFGPCDKEDIMSVCELIVLFANAALFATGTLRKDVQEVEHVVRRVMSTRITAIVELIVGSPSEILSRLCGLVNDRVSTTLQWSSVPGDASRQPCCFEAIDAEHGVLYMVNMFTGSILTNGMPPGGLPKSIRKHEKFEMLFGDQDFEVIRHDEVYRTAQKLGECAYSFRLAGEDLLVEEASPMAWLQLCSAEWLGIFESVVPATLSRLCSHWYWADQDCVLLRHKLVSKREVLFLVKFENNCGLCYEVARNDRTLTYADIVSRTSTYNVLVAPDKSVSRVFEKLESLSYVHIMISPARNRLEIFLPRYGLRFVENDDGQLNSSEYLGYHLSMDQRLPGQLYRFERYLVLKCEATSCERFPRRVLIPCGRVVELPDGKVDIQVSTDPSSSISLCVIEEHPRLLHFTAKSLENRLLLAAVYSACDNLVPWSALGMTGGQASNELLRGSASTRPFSASSSAALRDVCRSSHLTTTSRLKVEELTTRASVRSFLFPSATADITVVEDVVGELDAYAAASRLTCDLESRFRGALRFEEAHAALGASVRRVPLRSYRITSSIPVELCKVPVEVDFVPTVEADLRGLVNPSRQKVVPPFPLANTALNTLGKHIVEELEASWYAYHLADHQSLAVDLSKVVAKCRVHLNDVVAMLDVIWKYLCDAVAVARDTPKGKLLMAAAYLPTLTKNDVLRGVLDETTLLHFTATLSEQSRGRFKQASVIFMELCVLEDKLERIVSRAESSSPPPAEYFVEELTCIRHWKAEEHPYWLVFEVEGRLQIRPEQYIVAQHLIMNPGSICQLNMGRGKTRVILPMLFLHYRFAATDRIVRAHFLSSLLSETHQFMHCVLSSGALRLPFVELPFNRNIDLGLQEVMRMQEAIDEMKQSGGFVIVAPEHRLSLELKRRELEQSQLAGKETMCDALDALLDSSQYVDVFDESDALLHHKYHLVYAVGSPEVLDGGSCRWVAAEALIRVLTSPSSKRVLRVLNKFPELFSVRAEYDVRCGAYNGFTLSTAIETGAQSRVELKTALIEDLIDQSPFDFSWLKVVGERHPTIRAELVTALSDCQVQCDAVLAKLPTHLDGVKEQFLALRGLVAYGVLENCLERRNRVTFGLPDTGTRKKALAIPFTAADLPAERSEFSHPDVSIVLTLLAYFHAGLTEAEVRNAFILLLRLDHSERQQYYGEWFKCVKAKVDPKHLDMLSELDHISLDNSHQFTVVFQVYQFCTEVINFYLNRHVFPRDTKQYPQRLSRTAWDLVRGPANIGFSGTNDTHRLLPIGVAQREPDLASLRGTNGKMIDLLLTSTIGYEALACNNVLGKDTSVETWKQLLLQALEKGCDALIDTGALLAGVALDSAARFLIDQSNFSAAGVTYYDTRKAFDCWVVLERNHLVTRPLKTSPVHERDTFVIFDEARSRGSDMKLNPEAVALLTLGPTMTKDKLMQGAGRLRQLGRNQKLWFSSAEDVKRILCHRIERAGQSPQHPHVLNILDWVMQNTQQQSTTGLLEWAHNGVQFCAKLNSEDSELQDEDWKLERLYGDAVADIAMYEMVSSQLRATIIVEEVATTAIANEIDARAHTYGCEDTVRVSGFGEECERELQIEEEEEIEEEAPNLELQPRADKPWEYRELLSASCVDDVRRHIEILSVHDAVDKLVIPKRFRDIAWSLAKVFGTMNFWSTVVPPSDASFVWNGFLRIADVVVAFGDGAVVMLSECEADEVLKVLLVPVRGEDTAARRGRFGLVHLGFAAHAITSDATDGVPLTKIPLSLGFDRGQRTIPRGMKISVAAIVACQLLNGETQFASRHHEALMERTVRALLRPLRKREETVRAFIEARRMAERWSRSFLQDLAKRMDLEDYEP